jgi:hypothetical protein
LVDVEAVGGSLVSLFVALTDKEIVMPLAHSKNISRLICLATVGLMLLSSGCSFLNPDRKSLDSALLDSSGPTYTVRIYGRGKPKQMVQKLDRNKTVQDVINETGAEEMFSRMDITLVRDLPGSETKEKLSVDFDPGSRMVVVSQDYAIHPGDYVVIKKDMDNSFDKSVQKITGMLGLGR